MKTTPNEKAKLIRAFLKEIAKKCNVSINNITYSNITNKTLTIKICYVTFDNLNNLSQFFQTKKIDIAGESHESSYYGTNRWNIISIYNPTFPEEYKQLEQECWRN